MLACKPLSCLEFDFRILYHDATLLPSPLPNHGSLSVNATSLQRNFYGSSASSCRATPRSSSTTSSVIRIMLIAMLGQQDRVTVPHFHFGPHLKASYDSQAMKSFAWPGTNFTCMKCCYFSSPRNTLSKKIRALSFTSLALLTVISPPPRAYTRARSPPSSSLIFSDLCFASRIIARSLQPLVRIGQRCTSFYSRILQIARLKPTALLIYASHLERAISLRTSYFDPELRPVNWMWVPTGNYLHHRPSRLAKPKRHAALEA